MSISNINLNALKRTFFPPFWNIDPINSNVSLIRKQNEIQFFIWTFLETFSDNFMRNFFKIDKFPIDVIFFSQSLSHSPPRIKFYIRSFFNRHLASFICLKLNKNRNGSKTNGHPSRVGSIYIVLMTRRKVFFLFHVTRSEKYVL